MKYTTHLLLVLLTLTTACAMARDSAQHNAIKSGNVEKMKELIKNGAKVDSDATLLKEAAKLGNVSIVKLLLDNGAKVNGIVNKYSNYYTPLHEAARVGDLAMCKTLLSYGANVDHQVDAGRSGWSWMTDTPLAVAAQNHHFEVVKLLLENGADVYAPSADSDTILSDLSCSSIPKVIELLLELFDNGITYHANAYGTLLSDEALLTALLGTVAKCDSATALAKQLLDNGAKVNGFPRDLTPLQYAAVSGNLEMVKLLLSYGAIVDAQREESCRAPSSASMTPLALAISGDYNPVPSGNGENKYYEVCKLLLENGANVNIEKKNRSQYSVYVRDPELKKLLKKHGARFGPLQIIRLRIL